MRDIKVVVEEVRGFCDLPMRPGDYFTVSGGRMHLPEGGHMCLWALGAMLPLLHLKERNVVEENDWVPTTDRITCPDPNGRVIFHIQPLEGKDEQESADTELPPRLLVDDARCVRCGGCVQACTAVDGGAEREARIWLPEGDCVTTGPRVCRQCGNAPCVEACPTGALNRDPATRAILLDEHLCDACGFCRDSCRFGAIGVGPGDRPLICDLCGGEPACVDACREDAIVYGYGRDL